MTQAPRDSTSLLRGPDTAKQNNPKTTAPSALHTRPLFDKAVFFMLEREETLLGEILHQCDAAIHTAKQQVLEMEEHLENQI